MRPSCGRVRRDASCRRFDCWTPRRGANGLAVCVPLPQSSCIGLSARHIQICRSSQNGAQLLADTDAAAASNSPLQAQRDGVLTTFTFPAALAGDEISLLGAHSAELLLAIVLSRSGRAHVGEVLQYCWRLQTFLQSARLVRCSAPQEARARLEATSAIQLVSLARPAVHKVPTWQ
jgi:hypothetical protein